MAIHRSIAAAVGAGLALLPVAALAHAHLDHASPAAGGTVAQPPKEVSLWFTDTLEAKFSTIEVRDAQGRSVQAGPATLAHGNTAQLRVPLKPLPPGTYKVIWRVLSVDTHRTQGSFIFRVGP
ncbi:MAG TPA: copper homeostasis periplasmic binding protein CopC [Pseudolabrys sp.]|jgi:methionine-rich copper-binding protein CopC|nr:copper homeostasis periplasmic binding protein CopC [Pseudolabrys sp.]